MVNENTIQLTEILDEVYCIKEKKMKEKGKEIGDRENFRIDQTRKLKTILKALNIKIEKFKENKSNKENYDIPIVVAEVFKQYLIEDSYKKSFISKIINKQFLDITYSEKENFIKKVILGLKERLKHFKDKDEYNICSELNKIYDKWIEEAKFNESIKEKVIETKLWVNLTIEAGFFHIGGISDLDGLVLVNDSIFEKYEIDQEDSDKLFDELGQIDDSKIKYRMDLTPNDRFQLINYFLIMIKDTFRSWKEIANIACEIRDDNILEEKSIDSESLIKTAIEEHREQLKEQMKFKRIPEFEREKLGKILEEIKLKMDKKKNV